VLLLGFPAGAVYLLWRWNKSLAPAVPVFVAAAFFTGPLQVRARITSALKPDPQYDSNVQRVIMARTGWAMIRAHPWFGLGPEEIAPHFVEYVPADIPRPLPRGWYGHLHDIYIQYAAERGVFGLAAVLLLIGSTLCDFARAAPRAAPETRFVLHGAMAVIIGILAEGLFEHNLGESEILTMFLIVVAFGYAVAAEPRATAARISPE
jgi:O-antigen ligase